MEEAEVATEELNPPDLLSSISADERPSSPTNEEIPSSSIKEADLLLKIHNLHCPFTWKPEEAIKSYNPEVVEEIMNVDEMMEETGFKLRRFVIYLILCYNNFCKRLLDKAIKNMDEMEMMLLASMKNRSRDVYFTSINDALFHILQSCQVVMLYVTNQKDKADKILQKITPYDKLNKCNQAGIWAVRANLYVEFGYDGIKAAIEFIRESTLLDNENPYWYFTKGMYLGRLRRLESALAIPSVDEISALELAMKLKKDAAFMAFAAEVYVETANRSKKKFQNMLSVASEIERNKIIHQNDLLNKHALELFKKSVDLNDHCAHLLFRCGKGMLKLPPPHQDLRLARQYLEKGLSISYESSFGNHAMAQYYMKHEKDFKTAENYLRKAAERKNFGASLDLIRIHFLVNRDPDELLSSLNKLFEVYPDQMKHRKILAEIISYYLFINYNLTEAISHMKKLLYLIGDHDDIIRVFKSAVLRQKLPVSLLEILLSDLTDRSKRDDLNSSEQEICKTFLNQLCFENVELPQPRNENLRKKVVTEIKSSFKDMHLEKTKFASSDAPATYKEYNPAEGRYTKEYAKKYYAQEPPKSTKTVVEEFFEKYESAVRAKSNPVTDEPSCSKNDDTNVESNTKSTNEIHPMLQKLFKKMETSRTRKASSESNDSIDDEDVQRLAKRFDLHFSFSSSKSSKSKDHPKGTRKQSPSSRNDLSPNRYNQRYGRSTTRRSRSRESRRIDRSSRQRSTSPGSHFSTKELCHGRRSSSRESYSTKNSCRRSSSRESRRRPESAKRRYRRSSGEEYHSRESSSRRRRSRSRESYYRKRSTSRQSCISRKKRSEKRSTSRGNRRSNRQYASPKRRSLSRESLRLRRGEKSPKKRSLSRESRLSFREKTSSKRRSLSRESHRSRKEEQLPKKRSLSRESHRSKREHSPKRRSLSRESYRSKREEHSPKRRSLSRESHRSKRDEQSLKTRSQSRESHRSKKEEHSPKRRSLSRESHRSKIEEQSSKRRSMSRESHLSTREKPSKRRIRKESSPENQSNQENRPTRTRESRAISKESRRSRKNKHRSSSRETLRSSTQPLDFDYKKRSTKSKKYYESEETSTESTTGDSDVEVTRSRSHRHDRYHRRSYSPDEYRYSRRSASRKYRRSKKSSDKDHHRDYDRKRGKYKKYSSSEESSSASRSSHGKKDKIPGNSSYSESNSDSEFGMKFISKESECKERDEDKNQDVKRDRKSASSDGT